MGRFPSPKNFLKTYTKNLTNPQYDLANSPFFGLHILAMVYYKLQIPLTCKDYLVDRENLQWNKIPGHLNFS